MYRLSKLASKEYFSDLRASIYENKKTLEFWDQDLLNIAIDSNYLELDESLNTQINLGQKNEDVTIEKLLRKID